MVPLAHTDYIKPERYPSLTLVCQAVGSVMLAFEALSQLVPEVGPPASWGTNRREWGHGGVDVGLGVRLGVRS